VQRSIHQADGADYANELGYQRSSYSRAKMCAMERATIFAAHSEKCLKNLSSQASATFGNAATREAGPPPLPAIADQLCAPLYPQLRLELMALIHTVIF
jgi:hypothetical protein